MSKRKQKTVQQEDAEIEKASRTSIAAIVLGLTYGQLQTLSETMSTAAISGGLDDVSMTRDWMAVLHDWALENSK